MKTLSGIFALVVLGVIVIVAVVSCCNFPFIKDTESYAYVEIGHKVRGETPKRTYVEWKNQADFDKALKQVRDHNGKYCLCVVMPGGTPHPYESNNDCSNYHCPPPENIRTVKVTKSKAADNIAAGESAVNDPHVTYRVQSPIPGDIIKVLGTLEK
jgi:disulfide oxidoreductase YuzD